jgi:hypothetical protein
MMLSALLVSALVLAAGPPLVAHAQPPVRGFASVPDPLGGRPRTEIIVISPPPTMPGQTIILTPKPGGGNSVTVCSPVVGVGIMCTGPGK